MGIFRSYFSKSNTLIIDNKTNNSQNPVTELSYGGYNSIITRFIFDFDFQDLIKNINNGEINQSKIEKHVLKLTNTIKTRPDLIGGKYFNENQKRAGSFEIELFEIDEDWDEGNGYEFIYSHEEYPKVPFQASNWFERKTGVEWLNHGAYHSGSTIIATQSFDKGNEDIEIDITDYVNQRLSLLTTGLTSGFGLGIKFIERLENDFDDNLNTVSFFTKKTNTIFEPHIETIYDNVIDDDRNFFYLDKSNTLVLAGNIGGKRKDFDVVNVVIEDYEGNNIMVISGDSIEKIRNGVYSINLEISSDEYPDAVIFYDKWNVVINGKEKEIEQEFYIYDWNQYFDFDGEIFNSDNFYFYFNGILNGETIKRGEKRKINLRYKELYKSKNSTNKPIEVYYRIYSTQSDKYEFDFIPWTKVDRIKSTYEFTLDSSWFLESDYKVEVKISHDGVDYKKENVNFTVTSNGVTNA